MDAVTICRQEAAHGMVLKTDHLAALLRLLRAASLLTSASIRRRWGYLWLDLRQNGMAGAFLGPGPRLSEGERAKEVSERG